MDRFYKFYKKSYAKMLSEKIELKAPQETSSGTTTPTPTPTTDVTTTPKDELKSGSPTDTSTYIEVKTTKDASKSIFFHKDLIPHIKENNELGLGSIFSKEFFDKVKLEEVLKEIDVNSINNNIFSKDLMYTIGYDLVRKKEDVENDLYKAPGGDTPYILEVEKTVKDKTETVSVVYSTKDITTYATKRINYILVKIDSNKTSNNALKDAAKAGNAYILLTMFPGMTTGPITQWKDTHYIVVPVKVKPDGKVVVDEKGNVVPQEIK